MSSPRKIRANRNNARFSTGPRTGAGKATVAQNALRHGLSLPLAIDGPLSSLIERFTKEIVGATATTQQQQLAREVAYAQFRVLRVRRARHEFLMRSMQRAAADPGSVSSTELLSQAAPKLAAIG